MQTNERIIERRAIALYIQVDIVRIAQILQTAEKNLREKFCGLKIVRIFVLTILLNKFVSNEKYSGRTGKTG